MDSNGNRQKLKKKRKSGEKRKAKKRKIYSWQCEIASV